MSQGITRKGTRHELIIFMYILLSLVVVLSTATGWIAWEYYMGEMSKNWQKVKGTVVETSGISKPHGVSGPAECEITYQFTVDTKTYKSYRGYFGFQRNTSRPSEGEEIEIYYNPRNPRLSVLVTGSGTTLIPLLFIAVVNGIFASVLILLWITKRRNKGVWAELD